MNLKAAIAGSEYSVVLQFDGERAVVDIDARSYQIEVRRTDDGYLLLHDGQVFDCRVEGQPASGRAVDVLVGTDHYAITLIDPKRLRGASATNAEADGAARIVAPMPGKVVRVLVGEGSSVEEGAGIVVVEAMKMQNEMKAPKKGTVVTLNVEVGATVNGGDVLAIIE